MEIVIPRACSIVSMRELLDDPEWGTEEYARMILEDGGLLSEKTISLERYAPVKVWYGGGLSGDQDSAVIYNDTGKQQLYPNEKIIISYSTGDKTAHMECIQIKDIGSYADKVISGIITIRQDHE